MRNNLKSFIVGFLIIPALALAGNSTDRKKQIAFNPGQFFQRNFVLNPDAELNTSNVTVSGATVTRNTTTPIEGKADFSVSLGNNATDTVTWTLGTLDSTLNGGNCELRLNYTASSIGSNVKFGVYQGSNLVASTLALSTQSVPNPTLSLNVPCGDLSSATTIKLYNDTGNSGTSALKIDHVYYGAATNIGSVAQASMYGSVVMSGCTGGSLSTTSSSFADLASSGCSYSAELNASSPSGNVLGATFTNLPPGQYEIEAEGSFFNTGSEACSFRFYDGTNGTTEGRIQQNNGGTTYTPKLSGKLSYTAAQGSITIRVQAKSQTGASTCGIGTTSSGFPATIRIKRFPTSSEIAYRPELQALSWSGYHGSISGGCASTSATFADPTACTGITLNQLTNRNFGTVTTASGSLPGITFTPVKTGMVYVCATPYQSGSGAAQNWASRLVDGSGTIINPGVGGSINLAAGKNFSLPVCGIYNVTDLTSKTIKLQMAISGGSSTNYSASPQDGGANITWSIFALDQNIPAPVLVGSVTSGSTGAERIERVRFGGASERSNCTSSPCTIYSQSGSWVSSVTRNSTGNYTVNIASGVFTSEPTCTGVAKSISLQNTALIPVDATGSATSKRFDVMRLGSAGTNDDAYVEYICTGPR